MFKTISSMALWLGLVYIISAAWADETIHANYNLSYIGFMEYPHDQGAKAMLALRQQQSQGIANLTGNMVNIQATHFVMGKKDGNPNERPAHHVSFNHDFALGQNEVTLGQFTRFMLESKYQIDAGCQIYVKDKDNQLTPHLHPKASWLRPGFPQGNNHPVTCVNMDDIHAFLAWLNQKTGMKGQYEFRLPSEAEWEYAARQGIVHTQDLSICDFANGADETSKDFFSNRYGLLACKDGFRFSAPVASLQPNALQLYDMHGNLWEWMEDCWHENYRDAPDDGKAWVNETTCPTQSLRGGGWSSNMEQLRILARNRNAINNRSNVVGFRLARTLPP